MKIKGLSFSLKRAVGISGLKTKIAHKIGIPTTKQGLERKIGGAIIKGVTKKKKTRWVKECYNHRFTPPQELGIIFTEKVVFLSGFGVWFESASFRQRTKKYKECNRAPYIFLYKGILKLICKGAFIAKTFLRKYSFLLKPPTPRKGHALQSG